VPAVAAGSGFPPLVVVVAGRRQRRRVAARVALDAAAHMPAGSADTVEVNVPQRAQLSAHPMRATAITDMRLVCWRAQQGIAIRRMCAARSASGGE